MVKFLMLLTENLVILTVTRAIWKMVLRFLRRVLARLVAACNAFVT